MTMNSPKPYQNNCDSFSSRLASSVGSTTVGSNWLLVLAWLLVFMVGFLPSAHAELEFDGRNRFIFDAGSARLSIVISNRGSNTTLVQSSLAWGDGRSTEEIPLALNKPIQIIAPGQKGAIEVFYEGSGFPEDRETYLLLSVLDLSQGPREPNTVQLALLHHFKLFFRPKLDQTTEQAIANLRWESQIDSGSPTISNSSPYFITLSDIELVDDKGKLCGQTVDHLMVSPFSTAMLKDSKCQSSPSLVRYHYVTDGGNMRPYEIKF